MRPLTSGKAARASDEGDVLDCALEKEQVARFQQRLGYLAWRRYQLPADVAEDLVQATFITYLEDRDRYGPEVQPRILVGIFRNKCREHIARQKRAERRLGMLRARAEADRARVAAGLVASTTGEGAFDGLADREDIHRILLALAGPRPRAREMLRLLSQDGVDRAELIRRFGRNETTVDPRLRAYRKTLRKRLARHGIQP